MIYLVKNMADFPSYKGM